MIALVLHVLAAEISKEAVTLESKQLLSKKNMNNQRVLVWIWIVQIYLECVCCLSCACIGGTAAWLFQTHKLLITSLKLKTESVQSSPESRIFSPQQPQHGTR